MSHPLISVIVPVYNTASYLRRCLDSLCSQTYSDIEILCVDDGSTDESPAILAEYAAQDRRITIITQSNAGLGAARNAALRISRGSWITGLDSDDWLEQDAYEKLIPTLIDEVDMVCFDCKAEGETEQLVQDETYLHLVYTGKHCITPQLILNTNCFFVTKLWRKAFIQAHNVDFPVGLHYEDAYFYYTLVPFARAIYYQPECLYHYWQRNDSIMHDCSFKGADHLEILKLIFQRYKKKPLPAVFGDARPTRFELNLLEIYTACALKFTPSALHPSVLERSGEIAEQFGLLRAYPIETAWQKKRNFLANCFIKTRRGHLSYRFFGIPLLTYQIKNNIKTIRILGLKIKQLPLPL